MDVGGIGRSMRAATLGAALLALSGLTIGCPGPRVDAVVPAAAAPGERIEIEGKDFGSRGADSAVACGAFAFTLDTWAEAFIQATVPADAKPGVCDLTVRTSAGASAPVPLRIRYKLEGLDFGPYLGCGDPRVGGTVDASTIASLIAEIAPFTRAVRVYGTAGGLELAGPLAHARHLDIVATAWLGPESPGAPNPANVARVVDLAALARAGKVDLAVVGSETLERGDLTPELLVAYIAEFRKLAPSIRVTTADTWNQWLDPANASVLDAVDFVFANVHPYWNGVAIEGASQDLATRVAALRAASGKEVWVSETGWPSEGPKHGEAEPSVANEARYLREVLAWQRATATPVFWFEAYDEAWKATPPGGPCPNAGAPSVEDHWGLWTGERKMKTGILDAFDGAGP